MIERPRRNRKSPAVRAWARETSLGVEHLISPLFVTDKASLKEEIPSLPGRFRLGLDDLLRQTEASMELGIRSFVLFPAVDEALKDKTATYSHDRDNFYLRYIRAVKERFPECVLMSDVAMDPYSSDGHDGYVEDGKILNDPTLEILAEMSVAQAKAGIDVIGPSDMMDGRVEKIRTALDREGHSEVSIMSYTAKYASAFYGPFREALDSAPKGGDKKTYQMDPANRAEALREAALDEAEGADILMVKPALSYMDVIAALAENTALPVAAYNVSGEYAMLKAAAERGWLNEDAAVCEMLLSLRRAGAKVILTYWAEHFAQLMKDGYVYH